MQPLFALRSPEQQCNPVMKLVLGSDGEVRYYALARGIA
jgi:hypothetical protein